MVSCKYTEVVMSNKQKLVDLFFSAKDKPVEQSILFQIEKENKTEGK